jgi:hypothetical protein
MNSPDIAIPNPYELREYGLPLSLTIKLQDVEGGEGPNPRMRL